MAKEIMTPFEGAVCPEKGLKDGFGSVGGQFQVNSDTGSGGTFGKPITNYDLPKGGGGKLIDSSNGEKP